MKKILISVLALMTVLLSPGLAFAKSEQAETKAVKLNASDGQVKACTEVKAKITERIKEYGEFKDLRMKFLSARKGRWQTIAGKASTAGVDTTVFVADIASYDQYVLDLSKAYDAVIASLEKTADLDCSGGMASIRTGLAEARTLQEAVRSSSQKLEKYVVSTIIVDLKKLRTSLKTVSESK